ncbi:MAG: hypothetical protein JNK21_08890 [Rhodospirillaceae bacterium]|nr:hypothetical protein [Rhodospirillaceae bacterium]
MDMDPYRVVAFLHVLLFAYWLGADLGVFLHGKRLTRDDIPLDERLRTREIGVLIDMAPRSALVLMVPVGFTLASNWGLPLTALQIGLLWVFGLAWLWLVWEVHHKKNEPVGKSLQRIDFAIRYAVLAVMLGVGGYSLFTGAPVASTWLAVKMVLFGGIIMNGIWLRLIGGRWQVAFDKIRQGGANVAIGEQMIKDNRKVASKAALLIWFLVALMAFLGVVKPA